MPINEIETHPFLDTQLNSDGFNFENIHVVIVGTFPIYEITTSNPETELGTNKKNNWNENAFFQFFYGSKGNRFWNILANCFNIGFPINTDDCLSLLNQKGIFLSDTIRTTFRKEYSPSDSSLQRFQFNEDFLTIIPQLINLRIICFTSDLAKTQFCNIMRIVDEGRIQNITINNRTINLKTLPSPASNGRTVKYFFNNYPPTEIETTLRNNGQKFAIQYRQRIYSESIIN